MEPRTAGCRGIVRHLGDDGVLGGGDARSEDDGPPLLHGVHGVQQQRHEDLNELLSVPVDDVGYTGAQLSRHGQLLESRMMLQEEERLFDDGVDVDAALGRRTRTAEIEEAIDYALAPVHFAVDNPEILGELRFDLVARGAHVVHAEHETLGARRDRRERIVDLVHDAGGELADRRELFGLRESVHRLAPFGHVLTDRDDVGDGRVVEPHRDLRDPVRAQVARRARLHLELLDRPRHEHVIELGA